MGGEKIWAARLAVASLGSPPHGRGKAETGERQQVPVGITPAWAGKRSRFFVSEHKDEDHPRMGGEKRRTCRL